MKNRKISSSVFVIVLFLLAIGCSGSKGPGPSDSRWDDVLRENSLDAQSHKVPMESRVPYQTWNTGRDLYGKVINNPLVVEGDRAYQRGDFASALSSYELASREPLSPDLRESVELRLATTYLQVEQPKKALESLSLYFQSLRKAESEVGVRYAILFAYAYGMLGDVHQSLAWFSKSYRASGEVASARQSSEFGARRLLQLLPDEQFSNLSATWSTDLFMSTLIGEERARRSRPGAYVSQSGVGGKFWQQAMSGMVSDPYGASEQAALGVRHTLLALLPLTGRFSALGESTKNGITLALSGQNVELVFVDTFGDPLQAQSELDRLLQLSRPSMILGPLLSEVSDAVLPIARSRGIPLVSFSKRSFFDIGQGIFRFGPTVESQVSSLVSAVLQGGAFNRIAIVRPDNESGTQYSAAFRAALERAGITPILERTYRNGDDHVFSQIAAEIETVQPQVIFFPDALPVAARFNAHLSRNSRARMKLVGPAIWDDPIALKQSQGLLEGAVFVSPFFGASERAVVQQFQQVYEEQFHKTPDFMAAQGFDAGTVVLKALQRSDHASEPLTVALSSIGGYDGLTGDLEVLPDGEFERRFVVVEYTRGSLRELSVQAPSFVAHGDTYQQENYP